MINKSTRLPQGSLPFCVMSICQISKVYAAGSFVAE